MIEVTHNPKEALGVRYLSAVVLPQIIGSAAILLYLTPWMPGYSQIDTRLLPFECLLFAALLAAVYSWFTLKRPSGAKPETAIAASSTMAMLMAVAATLVASKSTEGKLFCLSVALPIIMGFLSGMYFGRIRNLHAVLILCAMLWVGSAEYLGFKAHVSPMTVINSAVDPLDFRLLLTAAFPIALVGIYSADTPAKRFFYSLATLSILTGILFIKSFVGAAICVAVALAITSRYIKSKSSIIAVAVSLIAVVAITCGESLLDPITGAFSWHIFENRLHFMKMDTLFEYRGWLRHPLSGFGLGYQDLPILNSETGDHTLQPTNQLLWSGLCLGSIGIALWSLLAFALFRSSIRLWKAQDDLGISLSCLTVLAISVIDAFFGLPDRPVGGFLVPFLGVATCMAAERSSSRKSSLVFEPAQSASAHLENAPLMRP